MIHVSCGVPPAQTYRARLIGMLVAAHRSVGVRLSLLSGFPRFRALTHSGHWVCPPTAACHAGALATTVAASRSVTMGDLRLRIMRERKRREMETAEESADKAAATDVPSPGRRRRGTSRGVELHGKHVATLSPRSHSRRPSQTMPDGDVDASMFGPVSRKVDYERLAAAKQQAETALAARRERKGTMQREWLEWQAWQREKGTEQRLTRQLRRNEGQKRRHSSLADVRFLQLTYYPTTPAVNVGTAEPPPASGEVPFTGDAVKQAEGSPVHNA